MNTATKKTIYENQICSMVGKQLQEHYPGWRWWVDCKLETGLVGVRNLDLDGNYGFYLPILTVLNETDTKIVRTAGGEILERYAVKCPTDLYRVKRDFTGAAIGDTSCN